ncbi:GroES-like protein [Periconia macrospinosa]|uniref:GroES-like protein n=1 Tax=Periconia macrospinosa TaxID=97972 RepID=A0A2V1DPH7_9PLEO|nr:GroES-like protein [Periconia macrospinosa]
MPSLRRLFSSCFTGQKSSTTVVYGKSPSSATTSDDGALEKKTADVDIKEPETKPIPAPLSSSSPSPTSSPSTYPPNKALVVAAKKTYALVPDIGYPTLEHESEVIIQTQAVGLNPIDWKSVDYNFCLPEFPWITGREMAGVVVEVGKDVKDLKVGDRVWTSTYYKSRRAGCFQTYVAVPAHTALPLPSNLTPEASACLGVAGLTAAMTLWNWLGVPMPTPTSPSTHSSPHSPFLLIWGGSAATGQFAIQLATLAGLRVIAVTSAKTAHIATALGAAHVVTRDERSNDDIVTAIREIAGDSITRALDLVGSSTAVACLRAVSTTQPVLFAPLALMSKDVVVPGNVRVETVEMKRFVMDEGARRFAEGLVRLVGDGKVRVPEIEVVEGGLEVVEGALERLKKGDLGGRKVVVRC